MNVLNNERLTTVETLLLRGLSQREIARVTGVHRSAIKRAALGLAKRTTPSTGSGSSGTTAYETADAAKRTTPRPPASARTLPSLCEPHREWITDQIALGRNAVAIWQDLVERHGFAGRYVSVRRFVKALKRKEPERFDVLEYGPGEEAQVDYGQGAPTLDAKGKAKRPYLFVMTLKYSGKSFRKVVWKTSQQVWARLHEEAFRAFGGCPRYVVLDNLKEGVVKPDIYEPELNKVYAATLGITGWSPSRAGCATRIARARSSARSSTPRIRR